MLQFIISLLRAIFVRKSTPEVAMTTFTPESTTWYSERMVQEALRQLRNTVVVVLAMGLFVVLSDSAMAQDIETPAGSCATGSVVLIWDRPVGINPITIIGWANPGSTYMPGERIMFNTGVPTVYMGDVYTIMLNGRTATNALPFSWECGIADPITEPQTTQVCRYYVKTSAAGTYANMDIRLNGLMIGQTRSDDQFTWFNVPCGSWNALVIGDVVVRQAKLWGHVWLDVEQPVVEDVLFCPIER